MMPRILTAQTSTPIHVTIVMHCEQTQRYDDDPVLFEEARTNIYRFASMLAAHGAKLSYQSDWTFLTGVTNYDAAGHAETGGTNIVAWMEQDLGFSIDPHNHMGQSVYTFADVAALIERCGATPSGIVGGFTALPVEESQWNLFQTTMTGAVYTAYTWNPQVLWGGASAGHDMDTNAWFSGVFAPLDGSNLWNHADGHLPWVGNWTGRIMNWTNLDQLVLLRDAGRLCTGRVYTCNIMTGVTDLEMPGFTVQFANQLAARTNLPNVRWVTIPEITNAWATEFSRVPSMLPFVMTNDFDGDGMTDGWEVTNFCGICDSDGTNDTDGDEMSDAVEYATGTSPTNEADYFRIISMSATSMTWRAGGTGSYVTETGDDLSLWRPHTTNAAGGPYIQQSYAGSFSSGVFRILFRP